MSVKRKCTIVIDNEVNCRVTGLTPQDLRSLWEAFGFYKDGYRFMPTFQLGHWDGKIRYVDKNGKTYTKILDEIIPYIISWNYEIDIKDNRLPFNLVEEGGCYRYGGWRYLFSVYGTIPATSSADNWIGWLYPHEIRSPANLTVHISPITESPLTLTNPLATFESGAYTAVLVYEKEP